MLYQLTTGRLPFDADTVERLIQQHFQSLPPSICEIRPDISDAVEKVIFKALAKRPDDRYQTAAELASEFRTAIDLEVGEVVVECPDALYEECAPNSGVIHANAESDGRELAHTNCTNGSIKS